MAIREQIAERAAALAGFPGQTISEANEETLSRADQIAGGTVFFYGRTPVAVGLKGIDWSGGHIAHQEWPAQLNRFFHLGPLASAYRKTKDEKYAAAARAYIGDWMATEDYAHADRFRPGDSGLNMSIRLGTSQHFGWAGVLPAFLDSAAFDDAFLQAMTNSVARQAAFLSGHLTRWGNWRISELDTLVFTPLRLPFLANADELLRAGITGMRNALATQFLPDGVHIERTPGYARWMTSVGVNYVDLARRFPEANAHADPETIARALDYDAQSELSGINDVGVVPRDPERLRDLEARRRAMRRLFPDAETVADPPEAQVFPAAGQVFVRSEWAPGAEYVAFDASTWGGGHGHLSRLSFSYRAGGRLLVADPGILNYEMSDPLGPYGKSTPAHSTLNANGMNQSEADARLLRTDFTPGTALIYAQYQGGYWEGAFGWGFSEGRGRGLFGDHRRLLFWVEGEYLLALDQMGTERGASIHNVWQLGPMDGWQHDPDRFAWWSRNADTNLFLQLVLAPEGTEMECFEGRRDPLRGWIGAHGHGAQPAPLVEFRYPGGGWRSTVSAVLLAAFTGSARPGFAIRRAASDGIVHHLELATPEGLIDRLAWSTNLEVPIEDGDPLVTDSPFAWIRTDGGGALVSSYLLDGCYLMYRGDVVFEQQDRGSALVAYG
jgi:hypothetical protein